MTTFPFILQGTITDFDGSTALASAKVIAKNLVSSESTSTTTNASGQYVLDLANMANGYSVGDVIYVKSFSGIRIRIGSFTITQAMIDGGGHTLSFTVYGLREHVFDTMFSLYNANLPPDFTDTDGSTTVSWKVTAAMPEDNPEFPVIIINPAGVKVNLLTMDKSQSDDDITVETEYFSRARFTKGRIDIGRDYIHNVLLQNQSFLEFSGLDFAVPEFIDDSNIGNFEVSGQKYNIANQIVKFGWNP